jgi:patatin-like phospholipase/acyl hydrolase
MKKKVRILSIDGGGIRGIIPATLLKYAESYLQQKAPGTSLADHFDFIAGTSTGGILTCIYLTPDSTDKNKGKFTAADALDFYVTEGYNIFNKSKLSNWKRLWGLRNATEYSPKYLESLLAKKFGSTKLSDLRRPCLITTYNMDNKSSFFFTSLENVAQREFYVRDVARSTSAAPTYFPPAKVKNIAPGAGINGEVKDMINLDGGVFANNPSMCAYAEARNTDFQDRNNNEPSMSDMYILSLGTGGGGFKIKDKQQSNRWSLLQWAKSIPEIMMDGSVDTVAFQLNEMKNTIQASESGDYLRLDVPARARIYSPDMSNADPANIAKLIKAGEETLEVARTQYNFDKFLDGLLD